MLRRDEIDSTVLVKGKTTGNGRAAGRHFTASAAIFVGDMPDERARKRNRLKSRRVGQRFRSGQRFKGETREKGRAS